MEALCDVELEVDTEDDLDSELEHEDVGEFSVYVGCELASAVHVTEEVGWDCYTGT